jgi:lipoprotein-releasing system permease protein
VLGFVLAIGLYIIQKTYGIIGIPDGFVVSAYPISMRFIDLMAVAVIVLIIGLTASIPAALRAKRVPALMREE